jgi:hypothetical protein
LCVAPVELLGLFRYIINDSWYASPDNMKMIKRDLKKEFVMPLKANRKVALSTEQKSIVIVFIGGQFSTLRLFAWRNEPRLLCFQMIDDCWSRVSQIAKQFGAR